MGTLRERCFSCQGGLRQNVRPPRSGCAARRGAMDFFMGLKGKDFVVVCSDTVAAQSIIRMKADEDKIVPIDSHKVFALAGIAPYIVAQSNTRMEKYLIYCSLSLLVFVSFVTCRCSYFCLEERQRLGRCISLSLSLRLR